MSTLPAMLSSYEVASAAPMITSTGLLWRPWVEVAVAPYRVTRLPHGRGTGLMPVALPRPADLVTA